MEHKRRMERKREEKEVTAKKERVQKAREAAQKARKVIKCYSLHVMKLCRFPSYFCSAYDSSSLCNRSAVLIIVIWQCCFYGKFCKACLSS